MKNQTLLIQVTDMLHQLGLPAHIKGFYYLRESIILAIDDPSILNSITKLLYPEIAKVYDTTPASVERAMRHAIEVAWKRGNIDVLTHYFGYSISYIKGKPTNSEFIAMLVDHIRINDFIA